MRDKQPGLRPGTMGHGTYLSAQFRVDRSGSAVSWDGKQSCGNYSLERDITLNQTINVTNGCPLQITRAPGSVCCQPHSIVITTVACLLACHCCGVPARVHIAVS